jgi:hypothetical protein
MPTPTPPVPPVPPETPGGDFTHHWDAVTTDGFTVLAHAIAIAGYAIAAAIVLLVIVQIAAIVRQIADKRE